MKKIVKVLLIILSAVILGVGSSCVTIYIKARGPRSIIKNGAWETSLETGSTKAGMYHRAKVALFGTLALDPSEVVYFTAFEDSDGETLSYKCDYRVEGGDYDARWWSLTAYRDFFLIPSESGRYSYSSTTTARGPGKKWTVRLSSNPQKGNWLPLGDKKGRINLNFRLYNPGASVMDNLDSIELPKIVREGCR